MTYKDPEAKSAYNKSWYLKNKASRQVYAETYRDQNRDKAKAYAKAWREANRATWNVTRAAGQAKRIAGAAFPKWADHSAIREVYARAAFLTEVLGEPYQVDHIVPLRSSIVCGLHCEQNLRVIEACANRLKSNKHWPDMP